MCNISKPYNNQNVNLDLPNGLDIQQPGQCGEEFFQSNLTSF